MHATCREAGDHSAFAFFDSVSSNSSLAITNAGADAAHGSPGAHDHGAPREDGAGRAIINSLSEMMKLRYILHGLVPGHGGRRARVI